MHIFDYSFLDNGLLPSSIVNLTATISALKALADERRSNNIFVNMYLLKSRSIIQKIIIISHCMSLPRGGMKTKTRISHLWKTS